MNDNNYEGSATLGARIRALRRARGLTLAALARTAGTSAPTLHRYESGWDRFRIDTLRRLSAALGARLEIRLEAIERPEPPPRRSAGRLVRSLSPLFWDRTLRASDLSSHAPWVLARVLTAGNRAQVAAARAWFGDEAIRAAIGRRDVDPRTRNYWLLMLDGGNGASQSPRG